MSVHALLISALCGMVFGTSMFEDVVTFSLLAYDNQECSSSSSNTPANVNGTTTVSTCMESEIADVSVGISITCTGSNSADIGIFFDAACSIALVEPFGVEQGQCAGLSLAGYDVGLFVDTLECPVDDLDTTSLITDSAAALQASILLLVTMLFFQY